MKDVRARAACHTGQGAEGRRTKGAQAGRYCIIAATTMGFGECWMGCCNFPGGAPVCETRYVAWRLVRRCMLARRVLHMYVAVHTLQYRDRSG